METAWEIYQKQGPEALWNRCCGFLDLSLEETMALQHNLLEEQLALLARSALGQQLFRGAEPRNAEELRAQVPLTTYDDYATTLGERREDVLPAPAQAWVRTSGRTGMYAHKWIPLTERAYEEMRWLTMAVVILSLAEHRGDVKLRGRDRMLEMLAPPPFVSGVLGHASQEAWPFRRFPPRTPEYDEMPFQQRVTEAFRMGLREGVDISIAIASVLAALGDAFSQQREKPSVLALLKTPQVLARLLRATARARLAGRPIYPKDVWRVRGLAVSGMDASLFREKIREQWGRYPLEVYASTEGVLMAIQAWDYTTMTFIPTLNFFEFLPEDEIERAEQEAGYRPQTRLLDEVEPGRNYELVLTNFHGRPLVRYRTGDIVRITGRRNERAGIDLPQMAFYSRRTDLIEVAGFVLLTERVLWQALEEAGIAYVDWTARKEVEDGQPVVRVRIEPKPTCVFTEAEAQERIHRALCALDQDWADMERMAGLRPLRVTYLPTGSFERYTARKRAGGAELAHLKPLHMNAT
ncbi:MAG TPA: GH3 auxin-responsive promoter family protein, partial [Dehalococcoidia bacterium]